MKAEEKGSGASGERATAAAERWPEVAGLVPRHALAAPEEA